MSMAHLKVLGKRTSPVRSQILLSLILFKEVTATKNPCSLDDFLEVVLPLSEELRPCEDLRTSWSGGIRMIPCILTSRNTIVLQEERKSIVVPGHNQEDELCVFSMFQGVSAIFY